VRGIVLWVLIWRGPKMFLERLGFTQDFQQAFSELARPTLTPARVALAAFDKAQVWTETGLTAVQVPRSITPRPVPGDFCAVDVEAGVLRHVLPRRQKFVRQAAGRRTEAQVIATNVDVLLLLMGLDADFNLRRLERYLTLSYESSATPVVLLTKAGLCSEVEARQNQVRGIAPGVAVFAIDVVSGIDADAPRRFVGPGITAVLLGSSGVGKSTLANHLLADARLATGTVRARDGRGRHTTTRRELLPIPGGGALIDTPGMRELALWADPEALDQSFADVAELASRCRFRDCRHREEPGCAVRASVESGDLDAGRLESYAALGRELASHELRQRDRERRTQGRIHARALRQRLREKDRS
jgi:ribosome biogenesis GTPase / thiamine phosphate phosphatase